MAASFGAASFGAAVTAASMPDTPNKSSSYLPIYSRHFSYLSYSDKVTLRLSARPELRFASKGLQSGWNSSPVVKAQLNEVAADGSSETATSTTVKSEGSLTEAKDVEPSNEPPSAAFGSEESISDFFSQVSTLVKLVDSKDIVELQLKQHDCEVLIRKKEALPQPPVPFQYIQTPPQPAVAPTVPTMPTATPSPEPTQALALPKPPTAKSTGVPFKAPMAGTFYRKPAPDQPPFVKIGDRVQPGKVLCILEAMKMMNEIESDTSGTIVDIIAEDGKPISFGAPLFMIQP